jgi:hypothetical protein
MTKNSHIYLASIRWRGTGPQLCCRHLVNSISWANSGVTITHLIVRLCKPK